MFTRLYENNRLRKLTGMGDLTARDVEDISKTGIKLTEKQIKDIPIWQKRQVGQDLYVLDYDNKFVLKKVTIDPEDSSPPKTNTLKDYAGGDPVTLNKNLKDNTLVEAAEVKTGDDNALPLSYFGRTGGEDSFDEEEYFGLDYSRETGLGKHDKVLKDIDDAIEAIKDSIDFYDNKGYDDGDDVDSIKLKAIRALKQIKENLETEDYEGFRHAQLFFLTLMNPIQSLIPDSLVKFLSMGGSGADEDDETADGDEGLMKEVEPFEDKLNENSILRELARGGKLQENVSRRAKRNEMTKDLLDYLIFVGPIKEILKNTDDVEQARRKMSQAYEREKQYLARTGTITQDEASRWQMPDDMIEDPKGYAYRLGIMLESVLDSLDIDGGYDLDGGFDFDFDSVYGDDEEGGYEQSHTSDEEDSPSNIDTRPIDDDFTRDVLRGMVDRGETDFQDVYNAYIQYAKDRGADPYPPEDMLRDPKGYIQRSEAVVESILDTLNIDDDFGLEGNYGIDDIDSDVRDSERFYADYVDDSDFDSDEDFDRHISDVEDLPADTTKNLIDDDFARDVLQHLVNNGEDDFQTVFNAYIQYTKDRGAELYPPEDMVRDPKKYLEDRSAIL